MTQQERQKKKRIVERREEDEAVPKKTRTNKNEFKRSRKDEEDEQDVRPLLEKCEQSLLSQCTIATATASMDFFFKSVSTVCSVSVWMSVDSRGSADRPSMRYHHQQLCETGW